MEVPFPGCPDTIRTFLAHSSFRQSGWQALIAYLETRFKGLQLSLESFPVSNEYRSRTDLSVFHVHTQSARRAISEDLGISRLRFHESTPDAGSDLCGFSLECDCAAGFVHRLSLRFANSHAAAYRRSLEVLLQHIRIDIEDALRAEADMAMRSGHAIERLGSLWSHLPFGTALLSEGMRILALNPEMDHLLSDRSIFRPGGLGGRLWLQDHVDQIRVSSTVEDVLSRGASGDAARVELSSGGIILDICHAEKRMAPQAGADDRPLIITARREM